MKLLHSGFCTCKLCSNVRDVNTAKVCSIDECRVAFWEDIVERGAWKDRAVSAADARMSLSSAELVCSVLHRPPPPKPKRLGCPKCGGDLQAERYVKEHLSCRACGDLYTLVGKREGPEKTGRKVS